MKYILLFFAFINIAKAGTCTSTTRSNYSSNQVLTSSALNADFNQLVTKLNAFDGGCITDGTLEQTALNASDFSALYYGIQQGCALSYSDSNTISIDKCIASVNGSLLKTATATTVTWGCSGCSAEVASTSYYVYIKTGSTGSTLTPLISTTAPNGDGYDNSGNKILGSFLNNASSNIDPDRIYQWKVNSIGKDESSWTSYTPTFSAGVGTATGIDFYYKRDGSDLLIRGVYTTGTVAASTVTFTLPTGLAISTSVPSRQVFGFCGRNSGSNSMHAVNGVGGGTTLSLGGVVGAGGGWFAQDTGSTLMGNSEKQACTNIRIPIQGW